MAAILALLTLAGCSGCEKAPPSGARTQVPGEPVEARPPNATSQRPASAVQTRAPFAPANVAFDVRVIASGLAHPWSVAFLPSGEKLVTERPGRMRIVAGDGALSEPVEGLPKVAARGQGGLLDVVLGPTFSADATIYFAYSEPRDGGNGTAVARARLMRDGSARLEDVRVIWRMTPTLDSSLHFGSRLVFARDGSLLITTGERSVTEGRHQAQRLDSAFGKIIRVNTDGAAPADNPFASQKGALPEIFSIGHRNMQGAALHPKTGELWVVDHGPRGGDEVNVVRSGRDYGWPTISYGTEYAGGAIGQGSTTKSGMEQPLYYWDPSIAPSGMAFYEADLFPAWKGSLFVGALAGQHVARLVLDGEKIVGEERLLEGRARVRDVRVGPDGALYLLTDDSNGQLLALVPKGT